MRMIDQTGEYGSQRKLAIALKTGSSELRVGRCDTPGSE
jgi:hypothetical protein